MYDILTMCNHSHFLFLKLLLYSIEKTKFVVRKIFIIDAGLTIDEIKSLSNDYPFLNIEIIDSIIKNKNTNIATQSFEYRDIIKYRAVTINDLFLNKKTDKLLQLDVDTYIIDNPFDSETMKGDIVLTVRHASKQLSIWGEETPNYPNLGVVFWNNPDKAIPFIEQWCYLLFNNPPHQSQFEQYAFISNMKNDKIFETMDCYFVPCEIYNCYKLKWLTNKPKILHFKSKGFYETPTQRINYFKNIIPKELFTEDFLC